MRTLEAWPASLCGLALLASGCRATIPSPHGGGAGGLRDTREFEQLEQVEVDNTTGTWVYTFSSEHHDGSPYPGVPERWTRTFTIEAPDGSYEVLVDKVGGAAHHLAACRSSVINWGYRVDSKGHWAYIKGPQFVSATERYLIGREITRGHKVRGGAFGLDDYYVEFREPGLR